VAFEELKRIEQTDAYLEIARVNAWLGNLDAAFESLARHFDPEHPQFSIRVARIIWNPFFRKLHDDPRWLALRERAGLSPERLDGIRIVPPQSTTTEGQRAAE
jgi:hypothetical protein